MNRSAGPAPEPIAGPAAGTSGYPLGTSRPPLDVADLPEPEEVFRVPRIGVPQMIQLVIGPSLTALGISIGSGEWLLGPQTVGSFGFVGVGWVITISAVLQTFYNVEIARYVVAAGEVPVVGFGRVPPGWGALIFPFALMYLNSKLPRPARPRPWHLILVLNFLFFGFFFVNLVYEFATGDALVKF